MKSLGMQTKHFLLSVFLIVLLTVLVGCVKNQPPVADAGQSQEVYVGQVVDLEGDASYDIDGRISKFQWLLTFVPEGSSAKLDMPESKHVTFTPDLPGVYVAELMVFDDQDNSSSDHVVIKVKSENANLNTPNNQPGQIPVQFPIPSPFPTPMPPMPDMLNRFVGLVSEEIAISNSNDISEVTGAQTVWDIEVQPVGAKVILNSLDSNEIKFMANTAGDYLLTKTTSQNNKALYKETFSVQVFESMLSLGPDFTTSLNFPMYLYLNIYIPLPLEGATVNWSFISKPESSSATIEGQDFYSAQFMPDVEGVYEVQAVVTLVDGISYEDAASITVVDFGNGFDHSLIQGNCISCHSKPLFHLATTDNCQSCHTIANWVPTIAVEHSEVLGACNSCHDGFMSMGKSSTHIPSADTCGSCHSTVSWLPVVTVDHSQLIGTCADCHNGTVAMGKNVAHISTSANCASCHSTSFFAPAIAVDHTQIQGTCVSCHDGVLAMGKAVNHPNTNDRCDECHYTNAWLPLLSDQSVSGLDIAVEANASVYQIGDLVKVKSTFTNNSGKEISFFLSSPKASPLVVQVTPLLASNSDVNFPGSPDFNNVVTLTNPNDAPVDLTMTSSQSIKPGETITREVMWNQKMLSGGLARAGDYLLDAFVTLMDGNGQPGQRYGMQIGFSIAQSANSIAEETALLTALKDPTVKAWYEGNGSDIMCRVNGQIVLVNNDEVIHIETFASVPESSIKCHTELVKTTDLEWQVFFHSSNVFDKFSYRVIIDALTGKIISADAV